MSHNTQRGMMLPSTRSTRASRHSSGGKVERIGISVEDTKITMQVPSSFHTQPRQKVYIPEDSPEVEEGDDEEPEEEEEYSQEDMALPPIDEGEEEEVDEDDEEADYDTGIKSSKSSRGRKGSSKPKIRGRKKDGLGSSSKKYAGEEEEEDDDGLDDDDDDDGDGFDEDEDEFGGNVEEDDELAGLGKRMTSRQLSGVMKAKRMAERKTDEGDSLDLIGLG